MSYESLDAFRAFCGEVTMPLEQCPICSKIPARCTRSSEANDGLAPIFHDDTVPEIEKLAVLFDGLPVSASAHGSVLQCATCRRLYFKEFSVAGESSYWSWERCDASVLFDQQWCVERRLPGRGDVRTFPLSLFPNHVVVKLGTGWGALDAANRLVMLDSHAAVVGLIDDDPPRVSHDLAIATQYAILVDEIVSSGERAVGDPEWTYWRQSFTPEELQLIDEARAADRPEYQPGAQRDGDRVIVRTWVVSGSTLLCRTVTVQTNGHCIRESTVIAPVVDEPFFSSLTAFRAHCPKPAMPLEQCTICSNIPETCFYTTGEENNESTTTAEVQQLVEFIGTGGKIYGEVLRCPQCSRLYFHDSQHYGNTIYYGNAAHYQWDRLDVDTLFTHACVNRRLPDGLVEFVSSDRLFSHHALVRIAKAWHALDGDNRLLALDGHDAITMLVDRDPPRVTADPELAKKYARFVDAIENPSDEEATIFQYIRWKESLTLEEQQQVADARAATGLGKDLPPERFVEMPCVAEPDGDRVVVRWWVTSRKRLICRVITVHPNGHFVREDAVIAENLPLRD